ncbi:(Fe-S)-binding protein [Lactococcus petauri]|uniref:(Fe-S)-binding protein n=1 Tax=Lactococcus petauri TaxID=1940789 RepID=UPI0022E2BEDE|nr:(Fe-S)-binding protein [Lactococcus petauri]
MKVSIFSTCVMDLMFPQVGIAMVEVLERLGIETDLPEQQICCGQPTYNSGLAQESMPTIKNQIDAFASSDYVVGIAGSCSGMFTEYQHMFDEGDPYKEKAIDLADKSYEFTQFLYRVLGIEDLGATFNGEKATYHRSCHMTRILGEREAPFVLLDKVKGLELLPLPHLENCCGFGGTFSVKAPEISEMMVAEKTRDILSTGAEILISADLGCLMNIGGKLNRDGKKVRVMHIAEILNTNVDLERIDAIKNPAFIK